ncbi:MAG TPA: hypothetical protein VGL03_06620 [Thermoanaerobaculia bacterium]
MSRRRRDLVFGLAVIVLFSLPLLPEIIGTRRLVFRDAQVTHWPWRRVAVDSLRSGEVPFINATASGGEPLLANPNAVLLYPSLLLETVLQPATAFNLHYLLHILWAFFGARRLARMLRLAEGPAFLAGVVFAFSGMMLSYGSAFMNSVAAAAWLPWCAAAALGVSRARNIRDILRAAAATGIALGLQLLAGEPALSLLTLLFSGGLAIADVLAAPRAERQGSIFAFFLGGAAAGLLALAIAAPLLLPLRAVFPLTYRGQHLYSERGFGAAAFLPWRALEWLLPRLGGDPGVLGGGANWLRSASSEDLVYIWCVTFGVVPLLAILLAALRRPFWNSRSGSLMAGALVTLLFSVGFALPLYRLLFAVGFLRRLRYPIKFYLLTTLCVALLAGLAAESLGRRRAGRREVIAMAALVTVFAAIWILAAPGSLLDRSAEPIVRGIANDPAAFLATFRGLVRGDAAIGALTVLLVALLLRARGLFPELGYALGFLTLLFSFGWGLPLFVSAPDKDLARPPALLREVHGPGRLYVSPKLPRFETRALQPAGGLLRFAKVSRVLVEQLVSATGAPFGARYILEGDPDGSYGFYNRLVGEAATASAPAERDRLLILFGARWVLAEEGEDHPLFRSVTGLEVAGRRLMLFEIPHPVPELRWAGRAFRRSSLSGTLELLRSERFDPYRDVALPGKVNADPSEPFAAARVSGDRVTADSAIASIEAAGPGFLVFSRTFFPAWRARLDGQDVRTLIANARDLAVAVPAGHHRVELAYERAPFRRGIAIQAAAFFVALAAATLGKGKALRQKPQVHKQLEIDVGTASVERYDAPRVIDRESREDREHPAEWP